MEEEERSRRFGPNSETVTIAILAKNKAHCLPLYLKCLLAQTFPKERTYLYIRTNDNTDKTTEILSEWIDRYRHLYRDVYFDGTSIDSRLQQYSAHQWNSFRFTILGAIRQESIGWALNKGSHYFVADCDNFIHPQTIEILMASYLPVVGPFLVTGNNIYSNYHHVVDEKGYCCDEPGYHLIYKQQIKGFIAVDVIHCTYFIRHDILKHVSYLPDGSHRHEGVSTPESIFDRHEYVIFSENLRKAKIQQYLDNRNVYGRITFTETKDELLKEPWLVEYEN